MGIFTFDRSGSGIMPCLIPEVVSARSVACILTNLPTNLQYGHASGSEFQTRSAASNLWKQEYDMHDRLGIRSVIGV